MEKIFEKLADDYRSITELALKNYDLSLTVNIDLYLKKTFIISSASYHENFINDILNSFFKENSIDNRAIEFIKSKGIKRQYHTYFTWAKNKDDSIPSNINSFLGLFGKSFKNKIASEIKNDEDISKNMKSFLEIGSLRNQLVHQNFLSFEFNKTFDEIVELNLNALNFLRYLEKIFSSTDFKEPLD